MKNKENVMSKVNLEEFAGGALQEKFDDAFEKIVKMCIRDRKDGVFQPIRCESCDYCKHTKILTAPISYVDLIPGA